MRIRWKALGWMTLLVMAGCSSAAVRPGLGDLSFRLTWIGAADLDLYVLSPLEERICFLDRSSPSGGQLDIDCNVWNREPCAVPMENVFWPRGEAPEGVYRYWVMVADGEGTEPGDTWRLVVRQGRRVVREDKGTVAGLLGERIFRATFRHGDGSRGEEPAP